MDYSIRYLFYFYCSVLFKVYSTAVALAAALILMYSVYTWLYTWAWATYLL